MALINAKIKLYENLESKTPPGRIWASPGKANGYIRGSVLRSLARKVGDEDLPEELVEAGSFSEANVEPFEEVAKLGVAMHVRRKLNGLNEEEDDEEEVEDD